MKEKLYFAYGSNMSRKRLKNRLNSASHISVGILEKHRLMFHKKSKDKSGKCDAYFTNRVSDKIYGVIYSVNDREVDKLDRFEGCGYGYQRKTVIVKKINGEAIKAFTYCADKIQDGLIPYTWYKYHILHGAVENDLPPEYISFIDSFDSVIDPDKNNEKLELSIYIDWNK